MASDQYMEQLMGLDVQEKNNANTKMPSSNKNESKNEVKKSEKDGDGSLKLPLESSPYVKYNDLEDYKRQGYGTEGHLEPKHHLSTGTDAPTLDGSEMPNDNDNQVDVDMKLK
ncbi:hypothetical protein Leryth_002827 [Lithospermum erythrorhizon]|uniref:Uncharacterized protein n=1 Tax=Lithospermum erythrorhizon TaxID=34254 RepID=A0AAV3RJ19_LITER|nr:hypothetical protein Leryth_002827 [Lithospermum erythrorhizon]